QTQRVETDCLAVSGGWNPNVGLSCFHRGKPIWREDIAAFVPGGAPKGMATAGAANGELSLGACLRDGHSAGAKAAAECGAAGKPGEASKADEEGYGIAPLWHVKGKGKAFV
ncbi:sarcosine oxidase subunit alpha, partial [Mesorhizobium sp. M3A.F.Ca.ET.201.01.1.1]